MPALLVPAGQGAQDSGEKAPAAGLEVPAAHALHVPALEAARAVEKVPGVQSTHTAAPGAEVYFPAAHGRQAGACVPGGALAPA